MSCLPAHGRVSCTICHATESPDFDRTRTRDGDWRITFNPLSWGSVEPEVVVLGFSKGPTQAGALAHAPHDSIAYKGSRGNVGKILAHVGLIPPGPNDELSRRVDRLIAERSGRFHFASLVRCTVERLDPKAAKWKGSGGGMLDKFVATEFGSKVAGNCAKRFLGDLPASTKLVVMFGLGTRMNYVREARKLFSQARPGSWRTVNDVAYSDGSVTVVHVEHFASQGALIPNWLGVNEHERSKLGKMAQEGVRSAIGAQQIAAADV